MSHAIAFAETSPLQLWRNAPADEVEVVIRAVYRQVLGNAHLMENERLAEPESRLKNGDISVREFVRQVAQSELYRSRFFEPCSQLRFIELNFKHLLGRAPESHEELSLHCQIFDRGGYAAEIESYLDSDEYFYAFGEDTVPYYRGYKTQTGKNLVGFTHFFQLLRGAGSSDRSSDSATRSRLQASLLNDRPAKIVPLSISQPIPDVKEIIARAISVRPPSAATATSTGSYSAADAALQNQYQQQEALLKTLRKQLAELQSFASIGRSILGNWSGEGASSQDSRMRLPLSPTQSLQQRVQAQASEIATLQSRITELLSLAAIGESRLNKWRSRTF
jgi:phycoerythrin-associated linker protein